MGMRAEESSDRAKAQPLTLSSRNSKAGRTWLDWLPIHSWKLADVLREVERANQRLHWAYEAGMSRLSCSFCILASQKDLRTAARLRPDLYHEYVALEQRINHTLSPSRKPLPMIVDGHDQLPIF